MLMHDPGDQVSAQSKHQRASALTVGQYQWLLLNKESEKSKITHPQRSEADVLI